MGKISVKNESGEDKSAGEILIYGPLSEGAWWDDAVTPKAFYDDLTALGNVSEIHVRINSYGGYVSAGAAIYSLLKQHPAKVIAHIDGFALSAASVVAMAGDVVLMPGNSVMMIHNPEAVSAGDSRQLRKDAETLDKLREAMIAAYQAKSGRQRGELIEMLDAETWLTASEAVDKGFADAVEAPLMAVAYLEEGLVSVNGQAFDLSGYRNPPKGIFESILKEAEKLVKSEAKNGSTENSGVSAPAESAIGKGTILAQGREAGVTAESAIGREAILAQGREAGVTAERAIDREAIFAQGREAGVTAERERQKAIDELAVPGMDEVIAKAKYETGDSPEAAAVAIIKAQKLAGERAFADRRADADASGVNEVGAAATSDGMGAGPQRNADGAALNAELKKRRGIA